MNDDNNDTKLITVEQYRKLVNSTVELIKANRTIAKLESEIQRKDIKIENLRKDLEKAVNFGGNLTPVSRADKKFSLSF